MSLFRGKAIHQNLAMTGEVTLTGRVLPVGGRPREGPRRPPRGDHDGPDPPAQREGPDRAPRRGQGRRDLPPRSTPSTTSSPTCSPPRPRSNRKPRPPGPSCHRARASCPPATETPPPPTSRSAAPGRSERSRLPQFSDRGTQGRRRAIASPVRGHRRTRAELRQQVVDPRLQDRRTRRAWADDVASHPSRATTPRSAGLGRDPVATTIRRPPRNQTIHARRRSPTVRRMRQPGWPMQAPCQKSAMKPRGAEAESLPSGGFRRLRSTARRLARPTRG